MQFTIVDNIDTLQRALTGFAREGKRIALVPTMGALHAGHVELIEAAKTFADAVVVSLFVNPKQFGPGEDFEKYPRMRDADIEKAKNAGATLLYTPSVEDMYPDGFSTQVSVGEIGKILCGKSRPGHFDGVATVVAKLLLRVLPHVAVFGEKDYQQLCIVSRLVADLDMPIEIVGVPTVRESDGLAMSSRNAYLSPAERGVAPQFYAALLSAADRIEQGGPVPIVLAETKNILASIGFKVDYVELVESVTLRSLQEFQPPARLLAAAWIGNTRLIDNVPLGEI